MNNYLSNVSKSSKKITKSIPVGIDFGTSMSCICIYYNNIVEPCVIDNNILIPTYLNIINDDIGYIAKNNISTSSFFNIKRFIGKKFLDVNVQKDLKYCNFDTKNNNNEILFCYNNINYNIIEIISKFLKQLKIKTELYINSPVKDCVLTVPAYFNNIQRNIIKEAGTIAGWNILQIINEPTSATLTYNLTHSNVLLCDKILTNNLTIDTKNNLTIDTKNNIANNLMITTENNNVGNNEINNTLIFDFGGGTLDITILEIINNVIEIKNSHGDNHLGGDDIDNNILQYILSQFIEQNMLHNDLKYILENKFLIQQLKIKCENSKKMLSTIDSTYIYYKNFYQKIDLNINITKDIFIKINDLLFKKCIKILDETLNLIKYKPEDINSIVFIGGSTRIPYIYEIIKNKFMNSIIYNNINPDISVAYGACIHCNNIINNNTENFLVDVTSHNIGIGIKSQEYEDDIMHVLIKKNTIIPSIHNEYVTTTYDNQKFLKINIFEGEDKYVKNNLLIKEILIDNIVPKPAGEIHLKITMSVDINNILTVNTIFI